MKNNKNANKKKTGVFSDVVFLTLFVLMLLTVLGGGGLAASLGLGPGWPELLQGSLGLLFLLLLLLRAMQLAKRARQ
jgi:hypothetical protein